MLWLMNKTVLAKRQLSWCRKSA